MSCMGDHQSSTEGVDIKTAFLRKARHAAGLIASIDLRFNARSEPEFTIPVGALLDSLNTDPHVRRERIAPFRPLLG